MQFVAASCITSTTLCVICVNYFRSLNLITYFFTVNTISFFQKKFSYQEMESFIINADGAIKKANKISGKVFLKKYCKLSARKENITKAKYIKNFLEGTSSL